jgi:riboflavin synthase alpha subunit
MAGRRFNNRSRAGQDEAAVVRRAIQQTLTALQSLGTRFNQEIDAIALQVDQLLQGRKQ